MQSGTIVENVPTTPIKGQLPGTSGLRKKTRVFMQANYLENFIQSIFNAIGGGRDKTFVVGGDGRYFNKQAIETIINMATANGVQKIIVGQNGILSTPAVSHLIRLNKTNGGLVLSASHNPGGLDEDFGVKYNGDNGGPAPENITSIIYQQTQKISEYKIARAEDKNIDLSKVGRQYLGAMIIEIIDPVADYLDLMERLFDFTKIRAMFASGFTIQFDAMHAVTGPYATAILEEILGAGENSVTNNIPLEDFGGGHPDPNPVWAKELVDLMMSDNSPDFGAASDGDGDRNMILGRGIYVTPSDSLAVLAANAHLAPGYAKGLAGVARSMPTSMACDRVAEKLGFECFETPTGWKFFGNLLDAGKVTLCGEESAGTGSDHVREKDGLWAILLWLNILAVRNQSVAQIMNDHWEKFGRNYFTRHDFEAVPIKAANDLMQGVRDRLAQFAGQKFGAALANDDGGIEVVGADEFSYHDPVDGSLSRQQGLRVYFKGGARAILRLSGTGTEGATVRLYMEHYQKLEELGGIDTQKALEGVRNAILDLAQFEKHLGRCEPDVIS